MNNNELSVICAENCGNSPKKQLLKEFTIAFVKNEKEFCLNWLNDNIVLGIVGGQQIHGIDDVEKKMDEWKDSYVKELHIHNIITHGNTGAVNGTLSLNDDQIDFCDVYNFSGFGKKAKIKNITSYMITTANI